jgi:hypothetical protein
MMKFCNVQFIGLMLSIAGTAQVGLAATGPLVVTATNTAANQLLVYDTGGNLIQSVATQGQGGVSGNAGGIDANGAAVAVVNFGSGNVSLFAPGFGGGFQLKQLMPTLSSPVSVAFGHGHLYVLGTTTIESHATIGSYVNATPDGVAGLYVADGSAAQVGVLPTQLVISEKSNVIETVNLSFTGAVTGAPGVVQNLPANVNAPFGLVTSGVDAYVTIAHADEISLVRNSKVLTTTSSGTQHAPCWLTLVGSFLFSANTASSTVSRYLVFGQNVIQDRPVAAQVTGSPSDIASGEGFVGLIDSLNGVFHLSIFQVDRDGGLALKSAVTMPGHVNGVAVIPGW